MANHISSKKRIRRNSRMEVVNKNRKNRVRTFIKKVELAIENGDKVLAQDAFKEAQPEMHRSITKGIFKKNTISRKLSRFCLLYTSDAAADSLRVDLCGRRIINIK